MTMSHFSKLLACAAFGLFSLIGSAAARGDEDFALQDGDTVVFLGDSITAAGAYGRVIENYTLLRFPERQIRFLNAGWGGDTAHGGAERLERDVFSQGATVVTVAYGVNDIGWGLRADAEHKQKYLDAIRRIVSACRERKVRVYICSAAITAEDPDRAEKGFLQQMCDEGMAISRELGGGAIDVQRSMREIQRRLLAANETVADAAKRESLHVADGVHLSDLGQTAMAFAILKGLGAPAVVSSAAIDYSTGQATCSRCRVDELTTDSAGLSFVRTDERLPINFGLFGALQFRFIPVPQELNQYLLTVTQLPPGRYELLADGRAVGVWTSEQWAKGVNIASATADAWQPGGPWDAQAGILKMLTEARGQIQLGARLWDAQLKNSDHRPDATEQFLQANAELEKLQRIVARPWSYRFVLRAAK